MSKQEKSKQGAVLKLSKSRAEGKAQYWITLTSLLEGLDSSFTVASHSYFQNSDDLFWPHWVPKVMYLRQLSKNESIRIFWYAHENISNVFFKPETVRVHLGESQWLSPTGGQVTYHGYRAFWEIPHSPWNSADFERQGRKYCSS